MQAMASLVLVQAGIPVAKKLSPLGAKENGFSRASKWMFMFQARLRFQPPRNAEGTAPAKSDRVYSAGVLRP